MVERVYNFAAGPAILPLPVLEEAQRDLVAKLYTLSNMNEQNRIILVGRDPEDMDQITRLLEGAGYIVSMTVSDGVAIDLAGSSDYDALFIGSEVPEVDRRYVTTEARSLNPDMAVMVVHSPESVLTQLRQAGIERFR